MCFLRTRRSGVRIFFSAPAMTTVRKCGGFCFAKKKMRTPEGSRRSSPKGAIAFWVCEVLSTNNLTQPLGAVVKLENTEHLLQRASDDHRTKMRWFLFLRKKKAPIIKLVPSFFVYELQKRYYRHFANEFELSPNR